MARPYEDSGFPTFYSWEVNLQLVREVIEGTTTCLEDLQDKCQPAPTIEDLVGLYYTPGAYMGRIKDASSSVLTTRGCMGRGSTSTPTMSTAGSMYSLHSLIHLTRDPHLPHHPVLPLVMVTRDYEDNLSAWFNVQGKSVNDTLWFI
jgi:hypothetical protein